MLIVRRLKLYYTASSIITPIGGHPVHRFSVARVYFVSGFVTHTYKGEYLNEAEYSSGFLISHHLQTLFVHMYLSIQNDLMPFTGPPPIGVMIPEAV